MTKSQKRGRGRPKVVETRDDLDKKTWERRQALTKERLGSLCKFPNGGLLDLGFVGSYGGNPVYEAISTLAVLLNEPGLVEAARILERHKLHRCPLTTATLKSIAREKGYPFVPWMVKHVVGDVRWHVSRRMRLTDAYRRVALDRLVMCEKPNTLEIATRAVADIWRKWNSLVPGVTLDAGFASDDEFAAHLDSVADEWLEHAREEADVRA